jgi:hypothetical protein
MLRRCSYLIGLAVTLVGLPTAHAADTMLTLACKGTETFRVWRDASSTSSEVNIGIIVDLQKKTLVGLELTTPLTIDDDLTETKIPFSGAGPEWIMEGVLDRMTGSLVASSIRSDRKMTLSWNLKCRPTQRMF